MILAVAVDNIVFDIRSIGGKRLRRKFKALKEGQKEILTKALRESGLRLKERMLVNMTGPIVNIDTGNLYQAFAKQDIISIFVKHGLRLGIPLPKRSDLNISDDDPHYYPTAVEYGHAGPKEESPRTPPHPFIRKTVNDNMRKEWRAIGRQLARDISRLARKG